MLACLHTIQYDDTTLLSYVSKIMLQMCTESDSVKTWFVCNVSKQHKLSLSTTLNLSTPSSNRNTFTILQCT